MNFFDRIFFKNEIIKPKRSTIGPNFELWKENNCHDYFITLQNFFTETISGGVIFVFLDAIYMQSHRRAKVLATPTVLAKNRVLQKIIFTSTEAQFPGMNF